MDSKWQPHRIYNRRIIASNHNSNNSRYTNKHNRFSVQVSSPNSATLQYLHLISKCSRCNISQWPKRCWHRRSPLTPIILCKNASQEVVQRQWITTSSKSWVWWAMVAVLSSKTQSMAIITLKKANLSTIKSSNKDTINTKLAVWMAHKFRIAERNKAELHLLDNAEKRKLNRPQSYRQTLDWMLPVLTIEVNSN